MVAKQQKAFNTLYNPFMGNTIGNSTGKVSNFDQHDTQFAATSNAFYGASSKTSKKE